MFHLRVYRLIMAFEDVRLKPRSGSDFSSRPLSHPLAAKALPPQASRQQPTPAKQIACRESKAQDGSLIAVCIAWPVRS